MIGCSCHAISDRVLREAAAAGLCHHEIITTTRAGTDCGHCTETVAKIVSQSRGPCGGGRGCPGCSKRVPA